MTNNEIVSSIVVKIQQANSIAIFTHIRPDGDAIGSAFALQLALLSFGKKCDVLLLEPLAKKFDFVSGSCNYITCITQKYDLMISVDAGDQLRLGDYSNDFVKHNNTICIDHHISNTRFANINLVKDCASSCQMILEVIDALNAKLDTNIATLLYMGVSTDTGNFIHTNTSSEVFDCASRLVKYGININDICFNMYRNISYSRNKLLGNALIKMRSYLDGQVIILPVLKEDLIATNTTLIDTEGFIDYALNVETAKVGIAICYYAENVYKVSFRSKNSIDVNELAGIYGGGGHKMASGCTINGFFEDVIDKLLFNIGNML